MECWDFFSRLRTGSGSPYGAGMHCAACREVGGSRDDLRGLQVGARSPGVAEGCSAQVAHRCKGGGMGCTVCGRLHGVQRVEGWGAQVGSLCRETGGWRDGCVARFVGGCMESGGCWDDVHGSDVMNSKTCHYMGCGARTPLSGLLHMGSLPPLRLRNNVFPHLRNNGREEDGRSEPLPTCRSRHGRALALHKRTKSPCFEEF